MSTSPMILAPSATYTRSPSRGHFPRYSSNMKLVLLTGLLVASALGKFHPAHDQSRAALGAALAAVAKWAETDGEDGADFECLDRNVLPDELGCGRCFDRPRDGFAVFIELYRA